MKKIVTSIVLVALLISSSLVFSQGKYKLGHIDSGKLLTAMPEMAKSQKELQEYSKKLELQLQDMQAEFDKKYSAFVAKQDSLSPLIKQTKTKELEDLQSRIQNFKTTANQDISNKQKELMDPIITKAKKAIEEVGKEKGYTYIFDLSTQAVLYFSAQAEDILPLVQAKLGIK